MLRRLYKHLSIFWTEPVAWPDFSSHHTIGRPHLTFARTLESGSEQIRATRLPSAQKLVWREPHSVMRFISARTGRNLLQRLQRTTDRYAAAHSLRVFDCRQCALLTG